MSRINTRSTHALLSSLRAGLGLTHRQHYQARNRLLLHTSSSTHTQQSQGTAAATTILSEAKAATALKRQTKKQAEQLDSTSIDSLSKNLDKDLSVPFSSRVTFDDVVALKPANQTVTPEEFNKLADLVAASFNVKQLRGVLTSKRIPSKNAKKSVLVNQIMRLMDLDVVTPESNENPLVEDPYHAERNFKSEIFSSNRRELFFILGSEGNSLRQLEKEKNVRLSISIADETYTIRGEKESIQEAKERIQDMVAVTEESWDVSGYNDKDLVMKDASALEDIARRSETFVSVGSENTLVIAGRTEKSMEEAKRLFDLKVQQEDLLAPLGMLPVYDSVTMSVDENQKSFFRISQTVPYAPKPQEKIRAIYPVRSSPESIGTMEALGEHLKESFGETLLPEQSLDLSVQVGQLLFPNSSKLLTQVPISTSFDSLQLKHWLKSAQDPYFFTSVPFFKAVSTLPLDGPKTRTIEVEYTPSSSGPSVSPADQTLTRIIFELNNDGELCIKEGRSIDRQLLTNIMMLEQPLDMQIKSEISTVLAPDSTGMKALLAQTTLPFANRLDCPGFFSFNSDSDTVSTPAASQVGLRLTTPTHTLKSILMKTTGVFQLNGLPLVASDISDQYGQVRRQELKLLPTPLRYLSGDAPSSSRPNPLDEWRHFMATAHDLHKLL
ncbi:hypothetical protein BGX24_000190 [Mortierella sp. AD032]|nr:hypothetical protein BGX24_000190 [Mortierella sp. AD032]